METKWLEDFVSLAETRSFSRSAQLRHVTQPAFSRRIQSLEAWAGTDLVDRSSYPTRLTPAGETLYDQSLEMLQALQSTRAMLRGHTLGGAGRDRVRGAAHAGVHVLSRPGCRICARRFGPIKSRLIALNVHDAVLRLVEGSCDLLIAYHHSAQPFQLDPQRYEMVNLGQEVIAPYVKPEADGTPHVHACPAAPANPLPYLGYAPGRLPGPDGRPDPQAVAAHRSISTGSTRPTWPKASRRWRSKAMASPSCPTARSRRNCAPSAWSAPCPPTWPALQITMDVRAYRERPAPSEGHRSPARQWQAGGHQRQRQGPGNQRSSTQALWDYLLRCASSRRPEPTSNQSSAMHAIPTPHPRHHT